MLNIQRLINFADERGRVMEVWRESHGSLLKAKQCYITTLYPGVVKGYHLHKKQTEVICCIKGMVRVVLFPPGGGDQVICIGDYSPHTLQILPGTWHAYQNYGLEEAIIVSMTDREFDDRDPDTARADPHGEDFNFKWERIDR